MEHAERPKIICLTPVKNEAWILDRFLQCASLWADHVIIADQNSDDGSPEIAARYPKVQVLRNASDNYSELERQKMLIDAARRIPGPRLLFALDADEIITANWMDSPEWDAVCQAAPGTVLRFQWANLLPGMKTAWMPPETRTMGFMDDGSPHEGLPIHSPRLPQPQTLPWKELREIKLLHYPYMDWERMKGKQRWYECWECVHHPKRRPISLYRQYHLMDALPADRVQSVLPEWLNGYQQRGIDMTTVRREQYYWRDTLILEMFQEYGARRFRKVDLWDVDWAGIAAALGKPAPPADPRSALDKWMHRWLRATQARCYDPKIRLVQRCLRVLGW